MYIWQTRMKSPRKEVVCALPGRAGVVVDTRGSLTSSRDTEDHSVPLHSHVQNTA